MRLEVEAAVDRVLVKDPAERRQLQVRSASEFEGQSTKTAQEPARRAAKGIPKVDLDARSRS